MIAFYKVPKQQNGNSPIQRYPNGEQYVGVVDGLAMYIINVAPYLNGKSCDVYIGDGTLRTNKLWLFGLWCGKYRQLATMDLVSDKYDYSIYDCENKEQVDLVKRIIQMVMSYPEIQEIPNTLNHLGARQLEDLLLKLHGIKVRLTPETPWCMLKTINPYTARSYGYHDDREWWVRYHISRQHNIDIDRVEIL